MIFLVQWESQTGEQGTWASELSFGKQVVIWERLDVGTVWSGSIVFRSGWKSAHARGLGKDETRKASRVQQGYVNTHGRPSV